MNYIRLMVDPPATPEFVDIRWISKYMGRSTDFIRSINLCAGLPRMVDPSTGMYLYRWTEIKKRLERNNIMPPDENHPLKKYSIPEVAGLLGTTEKRINIWITGGKLTSHDGDDRHKFIYRKDIALFIRNYDRLFLLDGMDEPLKISDVKTLMGLSSYSIRHQKDVLPIISTKRRAPRRISKQTLVQYANMPARRFRKYPMDDCVNATIARMYLGATFRVFKHLVEDGKLRPITMKTKSGGDAFRYRKEDLDRVLIDEWMREAYCHGLKYYTRMAIEHKFGKTGHWINEYISDKCQRVDKLGVPVPSHTKKGAHYCSIGWSREDVERIVATSGDEHITVYDRMAAREKEKNAQRERRKAALARTREAKKRARQKEIEARKEARRKEAERRRKKASAKRKHAPDLPIYSTPVDQIEAAIDAGFALRTDELKQKRRDEAAKARAKTAERDKIRDILGLTTPYGTGPVSNWTRLEYSESREIFTLVYNRNGATKTGGSMKYTAYPHDGEEYIVNATDRVFVRRKDKSLPSVARMIVNGLNRIRDRNLVRVPAWLVLVSATSYIPDRRFLDLLRSVPDEYGAVAPFGYEYILSDLSYDTCQKTYGMYSMYHVDSPAAEYVIGATLGEIHRVEDMDGPFIAVRGEYMNSLDDLASFISAGECRSMLGHIVSAICRKRSIAMASIPVTSVSCAEYAIQPGSLRWNEIMGKIRHYAGISK